MAHTVAFETSPGEVWSDFAVNSRIIIRT